MAKEDISNLDASVRAQNELQTMLKKRGAPEEKRVSVEEALKAPRVAKTKEDRTALRVLFISQDVALLNPETQSLDGFLDLKDLFEEVHILILREGVPGSAPVIRTEDQVWIYTATAKHWFLAPAAAVEVAKSQLTFAAGFRPDVIVARDPFESAYAAYMLGKLYHRPIQLHVLEDIFSPAFVEKNRRNKWRRFLARYTISKFKSIRTSTDELQRQLLKQYPNKDVSVLPRYQNIQKINTGGDALDLATKFKPFIFFIVYVGRLDHESRLFRAIDAVRFVLKNPRIALLVMGDGPARSEFERRAKILGIDKQVIFEKRATEYVPYLKAAHMLLVPDVTAESEEVIASAAALAIPIVMAKTATREDVFEHNVSAYLCEPDDTQAFVEGVGHLLNNVSFRKVIGEGGRDALERQFYQNPQHYKDSYQKSIEEAIFIDE